MGLGCIIEKLKFLRCYGAECGVYISSHPQFSSAAESVIPDTVYGLMSEGLRHTGGSETSRGINQEIPKQVCIEEDFSKLYCLLLVSFNL